jgi:hypothetical protein
MPDSSPFRLAVLAGGIFLVSLAWRCPAMAQAPGSNLPANAPTGAIASAPATPARSTRRAEVEYTGGLLHINASNASLNQILREIGRLTGMKITGGVQDDRVFGAYGPAPASAVLAKLLDGTSANLLIVENDSAGPAELILTPRHGGPSPPNPNAAIAEEQDREQSVPVQQPNPQFIRGQFQNRPGAPSGPPGAGGLPPSNGGQTGTPIDGGANLGTTPGAFAGFGQTPADATAQPSTAPATTDTSEPQSPGVSTPQQIYEQLQKLRQQQQQSAPTPQ